MDSRLERRGRTILRGFLERFPDACTPDQQELYLSNPDRATRCDEAAENGADGSTHYERIQDEREAFENYARWRRTGSGEPCYRVRAAVEAYLDSVESWHERNGSLHQEIG